MLRYANLLRWLLKIDTIAILESAKPNWTYLQSQAEIAANREELISYVSEHKSKTKIYRPFLILAF